MHCGFQFGLPPLTRVAAIDDIRGSLIMGRGGENQVFPLKEFDSHYINNSHLVSLSLDTAANYVSHP